MSVTIRKRYREGGITQKELGKQFDLDESRIWMVLANRIWVKSLEHLQMDRPLFQ